MSLLVLLDVRARAAIEREAVSRRLRETGGSLYGWQASEALIIACASGPGPKARHRLRSFEPAPGTTAAVMRAVRDASSGRYGYLGTWHTHPLARPVPSSVDLETARAMADQDDLRLAAPLMLILATTGTQREVSPGALTAWRWDDRLQRLIELPVETCDLPERYCPPAPLMFAD